jgi:hypothetical protein
VLNASVNAIVPLKNGWVMITSEGIILSAELPSALTGLWSVRPIYVIENFGIYELIKGPWVCKVEAINLLGAQLRPKVYWNSSLRDIKCGERYLFNDIEDMIVKGNLTVVVIPLDSSTCKRVIATASIINDTMKVNVTLLPIKPWVNICPPSKLVDVVIVWGVSNNVVAYVNNKEVLNVTRS